LKLIRCMLQTQKIRKLTLHVITPRSQQNTLAKHASRGSDIQIIQVIQAVS